MGRRICIAALLITGLVNGLHYGWRVALDFALEPRHPDAYRDLQQAAMWADGWMGLTAIVAAIGLLHRSTWGELMGIVAAAALIYMGFLDVAFHAQHGMYVRLDPVMIEMIAVDVWAFGMGAFLILFLWREAISRVRRDESP